ncbi:hypothetical protein ONS95_008374 [Cadophora gregata]|uniref:uncharacterized protein n=1 Tax=Cadophora gregata TaxID=51156 RepID=UPI0026DCF18E|nr:uncharacterized protein ONS95_008374 [Cadophora gregata]KAK0126794.1 hypothetical protein ONS95_008374 [Cadophora gregata]
MILTAFNSHEIDMIHGINSQSPRYPLYPHHPESTSQFEDHFYHRQLPTVIMSSPFLRADFYLRFNGRTTKRVVDMGSSVEKARPRPNPLERGPCPKTYHEYLLGKRITVCMICRLYVPTEIQRRLMELAIKERDRFAFDEQVMAAIERTKREVREEMRAREKAEESDDSESE